MDMLNWFLPCDVHSIPESETSREYGSKQVMVASSTTQREESRELSPTSSEATSNKLNRFEIAHGSKHAEMIKISEEASKAIIEEEECELVGMESSHCTTINVALIVDNGATCTLTSSFENCTDLQEKVTRYRQHMAILL